MRTPHRLQVGTSYDDALALLNDNFEKSVQDVSDLGASESTTTTFSTGSIAAGGTYNKVINILAHGSTPAANSVILSSPVVSLRSAIPAMDIFVDGTTVVNLYPTGSALTSGMLALNANISVNVTNQGSGLASAVINLTNLDAVAHTYDIAVKIIYIPQISNG